jgi:hypothetical protein
MSDYWPDTSAGPLFTSAAARAPAVQHSITSMQAADSLDARTLNDLQRRVYDFIAGCVDGATDEEMQRAMDMSPNTQRPRRWELERRGLIVARGTRLTRSRRKAVVWRAIK